MSDIQHIATKLSPAPVQEVIEIHQGGNSRIYKVVTTKDAFALKRYPAITAQDPRNRSQVETTALVLMKDFGITAIPRVIATDELSHYTLFSWVEGEPVGALQESDIDAFADFIARLAQASSFAREQFPFYASEACVSPAIILGHIEQRLARLGAATSTNRDLKEFIFQAFVPALQKAREQAEAYCAEHKRDFDEELEMEKQVLIPSDFGSHNALRTPDGLVFLDFEYFGWDDPVTQTANFILHPAMKLTSRQREQFFERMEEVFATRDPLYIQRLRAFLPLYALRWCTIILGEFIPERFEHRVKSGQYKPEEKEVVLARQLHKARSLLGFVSEGSAV